MSASYQTSLIEVDNRCESCEKDVHNWAETPQGRDYCPHCGTLKADEQRKAIHRKRGELP